MLKGFKKKMKKTNGFKIAQGKKKSFVGRKLRSQQATHCMTQLVFQIFVNISDSTL